MIDRKSMDRQLHLFQTELRWEEFPAEICRRAISLLANLCIEIVDETQPTTEEKRRGRIEN